MNRSLAVAVCLAFAFSGCPKKQTRAAIALSAFAEEIAKGHHDAVRGDIAWGSSMIEKSNTELREHVVAVFPPFNIGVYDWSKSTVLKEELLEDGAHRIELALDVCLRPENGRCAKPSTYTLVAEVVNDEGTWKVAALSSAETNMVR